MTTSGTRFRSGFSPLMAGVHVTPFPTPYRYGWDSDTATAWDVTVWGVFAGFLVGVATEMVIVAAGV